MIYNNMFKTTSILYQILIAVLLLSSVHSYIDITLQIATSSSDISYNLPIQINGEKQSIGISMENKDEFIVSPKTSKQKSKFLKTHSNTNSNMGELSVSSLQGYNLQGWKRFFIQVFTFADSRYHHKVQINLSTIKKVEKYIPLTNGILTLGPQLLQNKIYQLLKAQTPQYFHEDIVSFYTTPGGKQLRLQFGGYQQQNARGYRNGVRFYEKSIEVSDDNRKWVVPITKVVISKERGYHWDSFTIPSSSIKPKLNFQSQFIIFPMSFKEDLQTSFQTENIECSFSTSLQLQCENISSIDQALTFISLYLDEQIPLNISLYDLRDQYHPKSKVTSFFLKVGEVSEIQIGAPLLRGYYISLNMQKKSILFSPINRFTPQITTVSILRFIIFFLLFMLSACICIVIWQQFNNPDRTKRFTRGKEGVRLVAYQRANQFDTQD